MEYRAVVELGLACTQDFCCKLMLEPCLLEKKGIEESICLESDRQGQSLLCYTNKEDIFFFHFIENFPVSLTKMILKEHSLNNKIIV